MQKFQHNLNKFNGLVVRHSDMPYDMKFKVT